METLDTLDRYRDAMSQSSQRSRRSRLRALDYDLDALIDLSQPTPQKKAPSKDPIDLTDSPEITASAPVRRKGGGLYPVMPTAPLSPSSRSNNARARPLSSQPSLSRSSQGSQSSQSSQRQVNAFDDFDSGFGSSISKPKKATSSSLSKPSTSRMANSDYSKFIRPATGFKSTPRKSAFDQPGYQDGWPVWASAPARRPPSPSTEADTPRDPEEVEENGENFDLNQAKFSAEDFERFHGDPEEQMRDLLAGAVGEGEDEEEKDDEGADTIDGFADGMRLMPHQVRGVRWMRERETGRKYGGILADVSLP